MPAGRARRRCRNIDTTNAIESLNAKLRRAVKIRGHFPNDDAVRPLLRGRSGQSQRTLAGGNVLAVNPVGFTLLQDVERDVDDHVLLPANHSPLANLDAASACRRKLE